MIENIEIINNEPTDKSLLDIGNYIANSVADEVKKRAREGNLGELIGKIGATGDKMKSGDDIADEIVENLIPYLLNLGINSIYVYSEEGGVYSIGKSNKGLFIVIDPLDGSNNLRKGAPSPYVSVSIALGRLSDLPGKDTFDAVKVGIVRDIFNNRSYFSIKGSGFASVYDIPDNYTTELRTDNQDAAKINVYTSTELENSILGIDLDKGKSELIIADRLEVLSGLITKKGCQRRLGSSILDFCKVACGEYDGFVTVGGRMKLHDIAAAKLIVEEAGGVFEFSTSYNTNLLDYIFRNSDNSENVKKLLKDTRFKVIASANPVIHEQIKDYVKL